MTDLFAKPSEPLLVPELDLSPRDLHAVGMMLAVDRILRHRERVAAWMNRDRMVFGPGCVVDDNFVWVLYRGTADVEVE